MLAGRVYRFEDIAAYFEPLWTGVARALSHGRLPLWDEPADSRHTRLLVATDGEVGAFDMPLVFRARPRALQVLVP